MAKAFAQTYVTIHFTDPYNVGHMVLNPVASPKSLWIRRWSRGGKTYYFISEQTRREFETRRPARWRIRYRH